MSETTSGGGGGGGGGGGNVFLTTENLAFAMPLILLCTGYAYFKYVPLKYGIPFLLSLAFFAWVRHLWRKRQDHKLTHLDEKTIRDLVGEEEDDGAAAAAVNDEAKLKARNRLKNRIAQEKKARNRSGGGANDGDDNEDDEDVSAFAKKKGR